MSIESDCLRNELIYLTIEQAVKDTDFYRELYSDVDISSIASIEDLPKLPQTDKQLIRNAGVRARSFDARGLYIQNTSGSTGLPLTIYRSSQEASFVKQFFGELIENGEPTHRPIVLSLGDPYHGTPTSLPTAAFVLQGACTDDELLEHVIHMLRATYNLPNCESRVSILTGPNSQISVLTAFVCEQEFSLEEFALKSITVTSRYLTRRWRQLIESTWNAHVFDRYSLSEIFGGATFCLTCNGFHFDPYVVPELVCPSSGDPIEEGSGLLLLTSLYPFVQAHPFIRYNTGDLFQKSQDLCQEPTYRFLGRRVHSLYDPRCPSKLLMAGTDVIETLDALPFVQRTSRYHDIASLRDKTSIGRPVIQGWVSMRGHQLSIQLDIELTIAPQLFPTTASLADSIRAELVERSPTLSTLCECREAEFNIKLLAPGQPRSYASQAMEKNMPLWRTKND